MGSHDTLGRFGNRTTPAYSSRLADVLGNQQRLSIQCHGDVVVCDDLLAGVGSIFCCSSAAKCKSKQHEPSMPSCNEGKDVEAASASTGAAADKVLLLHAFEVHRVGVSPGCIKS